MVKNLTEKTYLLCAHDKVHIMKTVDTLEMVANNCGENAHGPMRFTHTVFCVEDNQIKRVTTTNPHKQLSVLRLVESALTRPDVNIHNLEELSKVVRNMKDTYDEVYNG